MISGKTCNLMKPALLMAAMLLCLSASSTSAAESPLSTSAKTSRIVIDARNFTNAKQVKRYLLRIISGKDKKGKFGAVLSVCRCAPDELDSTGSCFKNCLTSNGVNPMSAAGCAATCSINLIGCAICAGVSEWVVLGCAQYCVWRNVWLLDSRQTHPAQNRGVQQAKSAMKRLPVMVKG